MVEILLNYLILIVGIGLIGFFWSLTAESKKGIWRTIFTFVIWGVISYTIQIVTGLTIVI
ncbi:hypothetical protein QUF56_18200 [Ureibacillus composti]|nr:hypothetical protein [Ureibacillus composti]